MALTEAARELTRLGKASAEMPVQSCLALIEKDSASALKVFTQEDKFIDPVFKTLTDFVNQLLMLENLRPAPQNCCS